MAVTNEQISEYLAANPSLSDAEIAAAMAEHSVTPAQMAQVTGLGQDVVQARYDAAMAPLSQIANTPGMGAQGIGLNLSGLSLAPDYGALASTSGMTVEDLYKSYAGRGSDPGGLQYWTQQFGDTIDPNEIAVFQSAVAEARAQGTEPEAGALTQSNSAAVRGGDADYYGDADTSVGALDQVTNNVSTGAGDNVLGGIILAGDSFLSGDKAINDIANQTGQVVTNTAIGGQTSSDVLNQLIAFNSNGGTFAPGATVVLNVGGNDLLGGIDAATVQNNINDIVSRLDAQGVNVVLSAAPNVGSVADVTGSTNLAMSDIYNNIAGSNSNVTLVDSMSGLLNQKNLVDETGFHLTSPGQAGFNTSLSNAYLQSIGASPISFSDQNIIDFVRDNNLTADQAMAIAPSFSVDPARVQQILAASAAADSGTTQAAGDSAVDSLNIAGSETSVENLYRDVLGREADAEGLEYWKNQFGAEIDDAEREQFRQSAAAELIGTFGGETPDDAGLLAGFKRAKDLGISDDVLKSTLGEDLYNTYQQSLTDFAVSNLTDIVADNQLTWTEAQRIHNFGRDLGFTPEELAEMTGQDKSIFELAETNYKTGRDQIINGTLTSDSVTTDADRVISSIALQKEFGFTDEEFAEATGVDLDVIKSALNPVRNFETDFTGLFQNTDTTTADAKTFLENARSNAAINKLYGDSLNEVETNIRNLEEKWSSYGTDALQAETLSRQLNAQKAALGGDYYGGIFGDLDKSAALLVNKGLDTINDLGQKDKFETAKADAVYTTADGRPAQNINGRFFVTEEYGDGGTQYREVPADQVNTIYGRNEYVQEGDGGYSKFVPLTAEEQATLGEDGTYQKKLGTVVIDKDTGKELTGLDGNLLYQRSGGKLTSKKHYLTANFTPEGVPILTTRQEKSGIYGFVSDVAPMALAIASFIPGPHQPFARLANAALALEQKNYIGAVLSGLSAAGSFTGNELATLQAAEASGDVVNAGRMLELQNTMSNIKLAQTFAQGAAALNANNIPGLINSGISAYAQLGDSTLPSGVTTAVQLGNLGIALGNKQYDVALNSLGDLTGSSDFKVAGAAATLVNAIEKASETGDFSGVINAGLGLAEVIKSGPSAPPDQVDKTSTTTSTTTISETTDNAGVDAFTAAKNAGATDQEAMEAANAVTGVVINKIPESESDNMVITDAAPAQTPAAVARVERERLGNEYAASLGKTIDTLSQEEADNFSDKIENAIGTGGYAVLKGASIQDILSGNYSSLPTDEKGFTYNEQGAPKIEIIGYNKLDSAGNVINMEGADTGPSIATNVADAIVSGVGGLEGTTGDIVKQGLSTLLGAVGEQVADLSTSLGNIGLIDRQNAGVSAGKYLEDIGKRLELPETKAAVDTWVKNISDEPTFWSKIGAGVKGVINNPLVLTEVTKEVIQEALPIGLAAKVVKYAGIGAGVAADTLFNALESAGSTGRQKYDEEIAKGTPPEEAAKIADRSAGYAGLITMATTGIVDSAIAKKYGDAIEDYLGRKATTTGKEFGQESFEEGLIALATGDSLPEALTKAAVGGLVGGKTSGTIQTAADVQADLATSFASQGLMSTDGSYKADTIVPIDAAVTAGAGSVSTEGAGSSLDIASNVTTQLGSGADAAVVIGDTITSAVDSGADVGNVINSTVTSGLNAGASADVVINSAITSAVNAGASADVAVASAVSSAVKAGADVNAVVAAATAAATATGNNVSIASDANVVTISNATTNTTTTVDTNTGVTTSVDSANNVTTVVDGNTSTVVDANANTTSQTTVDTNNNTQTTVTVDANTNTNTQTTVNNNTNITTSVTVDANSTTQTTIDANNNTQTTVLTNTDTNTQTTVKVNTDTGDVIEVTETKVPTDWKPPVIEAPVVPGVTEEAKKPAVPKLPKLNSLNDERKGSGGFGLPSGINVDPASLRSKVTGGAIDPLARVKQAQAELERDVMMNQLDPRFAAVIQQRTDPQQQAQQYDKDIGALAKLLSGEPSAPANEGKYYSYGSEDSIDSILGGQAANYKEGGFVEPLKASGGMVLPLLAKSGGALGKYSGREDFKDGKHVAGDGDGQSDDIPAWLADGEFVFPADVVSALGNGSTKAGTDKLYAMMHGIRDRARSKGPKDLPPPAFKSPLDYLKSSKRSK